MPDPVLALVSLVGLGMYAVVSGIMASAVVRLWDEAFGDPPSDSTAYASAVRSLAGKYSNCDGWVGFWLVAAFWPIVVPAIIAALAVIAIFAGPVWLTHRVGKYIAAAQIKEASDAT